MNLLKSIRRAISTVAGDTPCSETTSNSQSSLPVREVEGSVEPVSEKPTEGIELKKQASDTFYHYCIARIDTPVGVMAAQLMHAAGESALNIERWDPDYTDYAGNSERECPCKHSYIRGYGYLYRDECGLCMGRGITPPIIHAIALGARDEEALLELERRLIEAGVTHRAVREPDAPYFGALMAIGIEPTRDRAALRPILKGYNLIGGRK